ncbi:hypothetical protein ACNPNN_13030 [Stenotrophomonas geniculata]|uniref:hypothetical protein n=1 Tax=Stenotrophomonas geniculata TaxID=86188 RepID=UPI003AAA7D2B
MSVKADKRSAEIFERRVRELLAAGYSPAAIAKETGKSYQHTARIVARVQQEDLA